MTSPTRLVKRAIKKTLGACGIDVFVRRPGHAYVPDYYGASSKKQTDIRTCPGFGELADATIAGGRSCLYYDRLYVIYQALAGLQRFRGAEPRLNLSEVGVYEGGTSRFISSVTKFLELDGATLHSFDTFEGHAAEDVRSELDTFHRPGGFKKPTYEEVQAYLAPCDNVRLYKGRFQDNCHRIASERFHFAHLDVDIHEPTAFALSFFDERMVDGGVLVIDDYGFVTCSGVKKAVDRFVADHDRYFFLPLLTGQCVLVKCR